MAQVVDSNQEPMPIKPFGTFRGPFEWVGVRCVFPYTGPQSRPIVPQATPPNLVKPTDASLSARLPKAEAEAEKEWNKTAEQRRSTEYIPRNDASDQGPLEIRPGDTIVYQPYFTTARHKSQVVEISSVRARRVVPVRSDASVCVPTRSHRASTFKSTAASRA